MKAVTWHARNDICCETVPDPRIEDGRNAIIRMTAPWAAPTFDRPYFPTRRNREIILSMREF